MHVLTRKIVSVEPDLLLSLLHAHLVDVELEALMDAKVDWLYQVDATAVEEDGSLCRPAWIEVVRKVRVRLQRCVPSLAAQRLCRSVTRI
jgi:hypothetical protein